MARSCCCPCGCPSRGCHLVVVGHRDAGLIRRR
jgi:hypothetical protein